MDKNVTYFSDRCIKLGTEAKSAGGNTIFDGYTSNELNSKMRSQAHYL